MSAITNHEKFVEWTLPSCMSVGAAVGLVLTILGLVFPQHSSEGALISFLPPFTAIYAGAGAILIYLILNQVQKSLRYSTPSESKPIN